jgi:hypothetical protein
MNRITILTNSRDDWKQKAIDRGATVRSQKKQLRRELGIRRNLENHIVGLRTDVERMRIQGPSEPAAVALQPAVRTQARCVLLAVVAVIPFRSVPRVLKVMQYRGWIPHFTSVINWSLRVGLCLLEQVKPVEEPWIAILDMSIDVAVKKVLVVLRVPLEALARRGSAIALEDCECIGLQVAATWNGSGVCAALTEIFSKSGNPSVILKDGGTDLGLGVRLWRSTEKPNSKVHVMDDIGHVAANGLKADFAGTQGFKSFLAAIFAGASKLRQSELAYLTPPKVRTKGRFQGITKLAEWADKIIPLLGSPGRAEVGSFTDRLRNLLGGLGKHRLFLLKFIQTCQTVRTILEVAKNKGINQKTYGVLRSEIMKLPPYSKTRKKLIVWLDRHINIQCLLSMGQNPLMVSSDVIESLIGKFKVVLLRNPKAEFNRIILSIPTLCSPLNSTQVEQALAAVNHRDLQGWELKNVQETQSKKKRTI